MTKIILLLLISLGAFSQTVFQGKILDKNTNEPVIGASIRSVDSPQNGTISNEDGEFIIKLNDVNKKLIVSHLTYNKVEIIVSESSKKIIYLEPAAFTLAEAVVGNPANTIISLVVKKALLNSSEKHYFKSFYQKTSFINGKYNKLHEMFFEMSWNTNGVVNWWPEKVRYAELDKSNHTFRNFIFAIFMRASVLGKYTNSPLYSDSLFENYTYKIDKYLNLGKEDEIVIIKCYPTEKLRGRISFSGALYIDSKNELLLGIKGAYDQPLNGSKWKSDSNVDIEFEKIQNNTVLKYIHYEHFSNKRFSNRKAKQDAWIINYEKIENFKLNTDLLVPNTVLDDLVFLKTSPFDKEFWEKNIPILHTNQEKEIIKYFEKKGSFKSNF